MKRSGLTPIKSAHLIWMCAIVLATLSALMLYYLPFERPHQGERAVPLVTGWHYYTDAQPEPTSIDVLSGYIPVGAGHWLTMSRTMREHSQDPTLLLRLDYLRAQVYLDGQLLFENLSDPAGENPGTGVYTVALPQNYLGKELRVLSMSPYALYAYSPDVIYFGDAGALAARIAGSSARDVTIALVLVIIGLLFMGLSVLDATRSGARSNWSGFCFGLFSILYGVNHIAYSNLHWQAFAPVLCGNLQFVAFYLFPIPLSLFLCTKCAAFKRPMQIMALLYTLGAAAAFLPALTGWWALPFTLLFMNPVLILCVSCALVLCALELRSGNGYFRFVWPAFALLGGSAALSAIDIGGFYALKEGLRIFGIMLLMALTGADSFRGYLARRRAENEERHMLEIREHLAARQFEDAEALDSETRLMRHELSHHLAALTVLQRDGDLDGIGDYLCGLQELNRDLMPSQFCEHRLVNAILSQASAECARNRIALICEAHVPGDVRVSQSNLSTLLLNLLENAIEAAQQAPEGERWINVKVQVKGNYLVIACKNAKAHGEVQRHDGRFVTTKPDARFHGYGILAMQKVAERHESRLNIKHDDTSFSVKTILRLNEGAQRAQNK